MVGVRNNLIHAGIGSYSIHGGGRKLLNSLWGYGDTQLMVGVLSCSTRGRFFHLNSESEASKFSQNIWRLLYFIQG